MPSKNNPTVRPRLVWLGLLLGLAGAVLIGLGVAFTSWGWAIAGLIVLGAGGALGIGGGAMYDAHSMKVGEELSQAVHGEKREGIAPGQMVGDAQARRTSRELDELRRAATASSIEAPKPPFANMAAMVVVLVGVFLLAAQWSMYPTGYRAQTNANWALGFAMLSSAGGLRILFGEPGKHLLSTFAILLCGVGLVLLAFLAPHEIDGTVIAETACGSLLLLAGVTSLASPATRLDQLPSQREPDRLPDLRRSAHPQAH